MENMKFETLASLKDPFPVHSRACSHLRSRTFSALIRILPVCYHESMRLPDTDVAQVQSKSAKESIQEAAIELCGKLDDFDCTEPVSLSKQKNATIDGNFDFEALCPQDAGFNEAISSFENELESMLGIKNKSVKESQFVTNDKKSKNPVACAALDSFQCPHSEEDIEEGEVSVANVDGEECVPGDEDFVDGEEVTCVKQKSGDDANIESASAFNIKGYADLVSREDVKAINRDIINYDYDAFLADEPNIVGIKSGRNDDVPNKRKRSKLTDERKKKKKIKNKIKRAEKNRKLGVKRLKLHRVLTPKTLPICRHYLHGRCQQGNECKFSHNAVPLTKSMPCNHFARQVCMKGENCPFDHQLSKYPCNNFVSKGNCTRGENCMFSHKVVPVQVDPPKVSTTKQLNTNTSTSTQLLPTTADQKATIRSADGNVRNPQPPKGINFLRLGKESEENQHTIAPKGINFLAKYQNPESLKTKSVEIPRNLEEPVNGGNGVGKKDESCKNNQSDLGTMRVDKIDRRKLPKALVSTLDFAARFENGIKMIANGKNPNIM